MTRFDEHKFELLLAEYQTLRDESAQARQAQQSTLQWSLAGVAALFGAGLLFTSAALRSTVPGPGEVSLGIFAAVVPGYSMAAAMVYAGEIRRMERVGAYIRALEAAVEAVEGTARLRWERYLKAGDGSSGQKKLRLPYIGGAMFFAGASTVSSVVSIVLLGAFAVPVGLAIFLAAIATLLTLLTAVLLVSSGSQVFATEAPSLEGVARAWRAAGRP